MKLDRAELDALERRERHLTILASVFVLVLAGGVALLMYPLVFVHPDEANKWTMRIAFVGFCVLSLLFVGYLLDRQRTVGRLKQRLLEEFDRNLQLRDQANVDLLHTIPNLNQLQDRLTMEFRRAHSMEQSLSLVVVRVTLVRGEPDSNEGRTALGEAARAISKKLRAADSLYLFGSCVFGLVLPETDAATARTLSLRIEEVLRAVGATHAFSAEMLVYNYPADVTSARELEEVISAALPVNRAWPATTAAR